MFEKGKNQRKVRPEEQKIEKERQRENIRNENRRNTKTATERAKENYLNPQSVDCMCLSCLSFLLGYQKMCIRSVCLKV